MSFMDLPDFIKSMGDAEAARLFGVTERAVMSWRLGDRQPRPATASQIIAASKGRLNWQDIYPPKDAS